MNINDTFENTKITEAVIYRNIEHDIKILFTYDHKNEKSKYDIFKKQKHLVAKKTLFGALECISKVIDKK